MSRLLRFVPLLLFAILVASALWPAFQHGAELSSRYDWRYFESMAEVSRRTVAWYHQLPLWNPYSCGGEVDLANPQSLDGAPTFLLTLLFGTAWGFKLTMAAYYFLALSGMYALARRLQLGFCPSLLTAVSFGLSGYLAAHLSAGHINFGSVALFPLLIYCFDRCFDKRRWIVPTGAVAAWIAVYGGTFTPALAGELLLLWIPVIAVRRSSESSPIGARFFAHALGLLLASGVVALLLSAYRMLPALEFIIDHPRALFRRTPDTTLITRLVWDLFAWRDFGPLPGRKYWSHEYTARLPQIMAPLLLCGIAAALRPKWRRLVVALVGLLLFSALLCMGNFAVIAPWSLLQKLPVLRDLRVPSRHLVLLTFFATLLGGIGAQALREFLGARKRIATALGILLVVLAAVDVVAFTRFQFHDIFSVNLPSPSSQMRFYHVQGHWSQMRELIFGGYGVSGCDEEAPLQRAKSLELGDVPQARLADESAGKIIDLQFSPDRRRITVELSQSNTLLLINSNWNEHFKLDKENANLGARIEHPDGKLAVNLAPLGPGRHTIEVRFAPRSFTVGVVLSLLAWPFFLGVFFRGRFSRKSSESREAAQRIT